MDVIDLGCGTGELTRKLADLLPGSTVLGIDASLEMLQNAKSFENAQLQFCHSTIEAQTATEKKWHLVFSNAAIQWVDNHEALLAKIIASLQPGGQLAIQIPAQHHNISNRLLNGLADEQPFATMLSGWNRLSPVLDIDVYAEILYRNRAKKITVFEKIYPLILQNANALFDWVSGTALIPYMDKLSEAQAVNFAAAYKKRLQDFFPQTPIFYPFKRILLAAQW